MIKKFAQRSTNLFGDRRGRDTQRVDQTNFLFHQTQIRRTISYRRDSCSSR